MTTPQIRIIDGNTVTDRDMNADELAVRKIILDDLEAQKRFAADAAAARASAVAKLAGLGLTPDEIAALVGA